MAQKWDTQGLKGECDLADAIDRELRCHPPPVAATAVIERLKSRHTDSSVQHGLASIAVDAVWTKARLHQHGLADDPFCTRCDGRLPDTTHHRAWVCPATAAIRNQTATKDQIARARREPNSLLWSKGWIPSLSSLLPQPADLEMRMWTPDDGECVVEDLADIAGSMSGAIFIDGSADTPADPRRRRAGWAVVEVAPSLTDGQLVRRRAIWGTAPSTWPQSSQAGEFAAAVAAATLGTAGASIYTDCASVMRVMQGHPCVAQHPARLWAGAYRDAHCTPDGPTLMKGMRKVRAHQTERPDESADDRFRRLGNDWADEKAKCGRRLHPTPVAAIRGCCDQMWRDAQAACDTLGRATTEWPDAAGMLQKPRQKSTRSARAAAAEKNRLKADARRAQRMSERSKRQRQARDSHSWAAVGQGRRRCVDCLAWDKVDVARCTGITAAWGLRIDDAIAKGHTLQRGLLYSAGSGCPLHLLACVRCGSYTTGARLLGLADACHPPTAAGRAALSRLADGRNPKPGRKPECFAQCS